MIVGEFLCKSVYSQGRGHRQSCDELVEGKPADQEGADFGLIGKVQSKFFERADPVGAAVGQVRVVCIGVEVGK